LVQITYLPVSIIPFSIRLFGETIAILVVIF
jgi:hypothetical protein